jgi:uncharacterized protein YjiS (DUF1127 family)
MDPRRSQDQIGLFSTLPASPTAEQVEAIRAQAVQARDAALAAGLRRAVLGLGEVLSLVAATLLSWPARRATYDKLRRLSDRELADIGLTRGDISRVFEPDFRLPARPANANEALATGRVQAA